MTSTMTSPAPSAVESASIAAIAPPIRVYIHDRPGHAWAQVANRGSLVPTPREFPPDAIRPGWTVGWAVTRAVRSLRARAFLGNTLLDGGARLDSLGGGGGVTVDICVVELENCALCLAAQFKSKVEGTDRKKRELEGERVSLVERLVAEIKQRLDEFRKESEALQISEEKELRTVRLDFAIIEAKPRREAARYIRRLRQELAAAAAADAPAATTGSNQGEEEEDYDGLSRLVDEIKQRQDKCRKELEELRSSQELRMSRERKLKRDYAVVKIELRREAAGHVRRLRQELAYATAASADAPPASGNDQEEESCPCCRREFGQVSKVFQCFNGHAFCGDCEPQLSSCPMCRDSFRAARPVRNLLAERLLGLDARVRFASVPAGSTSMQRG